MSASVARVGVALRLGPRGAWLVALVLASGVAAGAALATRLGLLPALLGLVALGVVSLLSVRWPLLPLAVFAALIPIEEVAVIGGFGTVSRLAGILFAVSYGVPRLGSLALGVMKPAAWAYLAWALVSMGWALDPAVAWSELATLLQLFVIAILVADFVVRRPEIVRPVFWVYSVAAAATALVGTWAYIGQGIGVDARAAAIQDQDPAQFAAVLLPALVFGLFELLNGPRRILGGGIALATTLGVIVSGTRGAWLAAAVVVALLVLPQLRPRQRLAAVIASVLLIVVAFQVPGVPDLVAERTGNAISTGGAGRTDIWSVAITIYGRAPVLGVGYANFPVAYTPEVVRASGIGSWLHLEGRAPHNLVLGTLVELGPLGLLLLALFIGPLVVRRGWGPEAATVQAALASLLVMALFLDVLANRKQVWLVIGIAAGLAYLAERNRATTATGTPDTVGPAPPTPIVDAVARGPGVPARAART